MLSCAPAGRPQRPQVLGSVLAIWMYHALGETEVAASEVCLHTFCISVAVNIVVHPTLNASLSLSDI